MPIQVTSTTDTPENVAKAMQGDQDAVDENQSASAESVDETAEESDTQEQEASEDASSEEESDKPKKKNGFKKRINKLTSRLTAKEQEVEYWKAQALKSQPPREAEAPKTETQGKPKSEDFESHDQYVEALTDWKVEQKAKELEAKQRETHTKTEFQRRVESHQERVNKFVQEHPDFRDVIEDVDDIPMSLGVQETILSSDHGPELMYELAKNRDEFERICKLSPIQAARELGKVEARLEKINQKVTAKPSKPAPLKTVSSGTGGSVKKSIYDQDLSQREYERLRAEQLKRRAQGS